MEYSGSLFEQAGEDISTAGAYERHSGMQSVQNLEAVINEGFASPCWRRRRISHWRCCWSTWEKR